MCHNFDTLFDTFFQIPPDDSLPDRICISCVHQLTISYSFKTLIEASAKTLSENIYFSDTSSNNNDSSNESNDFKSLEVVQRKQKKKSQKVLTKPTLFEYKSLFCVECKAEFHSKKSLYDHCVTNHTVKSTVGRYCNYCNEKFKDFRSLVLHRRLHIKPFICENCWQGFYDTEELKNHLCQPDLDNKDIYKHERRMKQCDQCGKSYLPGYLRVHLLTHGNVLAYSCKYCPKKFKTRCILNSHTLWNHIRTRNYKCDICDATFISSSSRGAHIKQCHLKEKKYACDSCDKRFFSKSKLRGHSFSHTGVKKFCCDLCNKSYQLKKSLQIHLKSHSKE